MTKNRFRQNRQIRNLVVMILYSLKQLSSIIIPPSKRKLLVEYH